MSPRGRPRSLAIRSRVLFLFHLQKYHRGAGAIDGLPRRKTVGQVSPNNTVLGQVCISVKVVQRHFGGPVQFRANTRMRNKSKLALPYICRFNVLSRLTCPSVWPLLHLEPIASSTAA